jgi:hypothetical protein
MTSVEWPRTREALIEEQRRLPALDSVGCGIRFSRGEAIFVDQSAESISPLDAVWSRRVRAPEHWPL